MLLYSGAALAKGGASKPPDTGNQDPFGATPNLSFPLVFTDLIDILYAKIWVDSDLDGIRDQNEWYTAYDANENGVLDDDLDGLLEEGEDNITPTAGPLIPLVVSEVFGTAYSGTYPGQIEPPYNDETYDLAYYSTYVLEEGGCFVDLVNNETGELVPDGVADVTEPILMTTWLPEQEPWYPHPGSYVDANPNLTWQTDNVVVGDYANSWQADYAALIDTDLSDDVAYEAPVINIDFIDWGNPLENTYPLVGYRFPVEITLYQKLTETMTAYKMGCLEYPSSADELYATSDLLTGSKTYESFYATVMTNKFRCEVHPPIGAPYTIDLGPGIGPTGKMNFASAGGGWVPTMEGVHRIYFYMLDPKIRFDGAIINNDEHYVMSTLCGPAEQLSPNTINKSVISSYNTTWIDVLVKKPNSSGGRKK
jgi:hypothetical protein